MRFSPLIDSAMALFNDWFMCACSACVVVVSEENASKGPRKQTYLIHPTFEPIAVVVYRVDDRRAADREVATLVRVGFEKCSHLGLNLHHAMLIVCSDIPQAFQLQIQPVRDDLHDVRRRRVPPESLLPCPHDFTRPNEIVI